MLILEVSHVFPIETQWICSMLMHVKDKERGIFPLKAFTHIHIRIALYQRV